MFSSQSQHPHPTICSSLALCTFLALATAALDVVGAAASDSSGVSDGKLMVSRETDKGGIKMWCLHNFGLFYPYHSSLHSVTKNIFIQLP